MMLNALLTNLSFFSITDVLLFNIPPTWKIAQGLIMIIQLLCDYDRDVKFNKLVGELPPSIILEPLRFL